MTLIKPDAVPRFKRWLIQNGAEILANTNQYELIRFRCDAGVGVVYASAKGATSYSGEIAKEAVKCWLYCRPWVHKKSGTKRGNSNRLKREILIRDGDRCFYCGQPMPDDDQTLEHLISLLVGGQHRIENCVLAHKKCNNDAGCLPLAEKIKMRDRLRYGIDNDKSN